MKTKLNIFDFDGTLVSTLESDAGKELYHKLTGKQWMIENTPQAIENGFDPKFRRTGWWGRPETLQPPLLPRPLPPDYVIKETLYGYRLAKADKDAENVMVTGRHMKLAPLVEDVLNELEFKFDRYYYKGHPELVATGKYPKDNDTPVYKMFVIRDFLMKDHITHLEIWEDRDDIIDLFQSKLVKELEVRFPRLDFVCIHDAKKKKAYYHPLYAGRLRVSIGCKVPPE